jgi:hypothetical protein
MGQANQLVNTLANAHNPNMVGDLCQRALAKIKDSRQPIQRAKQELLKFLSNDS